MSDTTIYELKKPFTISASEGDTLIDAVEVSLPQNNGRTQAAVLEFYSWIQSTQLAGVISLQKAIAKGEVKETKVEAPEPDTSVPTTLTPEEEAQQFVLQCTYGNPTFHSDLVNKFRVLTKKCPDIAKFNSAPLGDLHYNSMGIKDLIGLSSFWVVFFLAN